ncbi:NAD-dependent epimerase/dehydratase family protein [Tersicoccus sp. MR15.9]|uniref:NAD-dependent epimerase/dehydratase family protein n=1 Tax=Tersicoccus mangrovi TaxID=3121635 RepID=UPI002FE65039
MRVAVLGGRGFIGQALVERLTRSSVPVVTVVAPRLRSHAADVDEVLTDARAEVEVIAHLTELFRGTDVVINAAGMASPDGGARDRMTGANAVLPVVAALAAQRAGVTRFVHLSSAAVQGDRPRLDESDDLAPFSAYSRSKALAERSLRLLDGRPDERLDAQSDAPTQIVIVRATSVQGPGRHTTAALARIARSPLASVASGSPRSTPVVSVRHLVGFVLTVAGWSGELPPVVLQPGEGLRTDEVLRLAGGRDPLTVPAALCRAAVRAGYLASRVAGDRLRGAVRRVELMWFGQEDDPAWARENGVTVHGDVRDVLERAGRRQR